MPTMCFSTLAQVGTRKCIELIPPERLGFLLAEMRGSAVAAARHRYGTLQAVGSSRARQQFVTGDHRELFLRQQLELFQMQQAVDSLKLQQPEDFQLPKPVTPARMKCPPLTRAEAAKVSLKPFQRKMAGRNASVDPCHWEDRPTTVMVRQLPRQYTQQNFLEEVVARGFGDLFDFLYLPWDIRNGTNIGGYGFVNFIRAEYALLFRDAFTGLVLEGKTLRVHPAQVQGFEANYRHFAGTKTGQAPAYRPLFKHQAASS
eukprot:Skav230200  [mRNA]  locus=scaffold2443:47716:49956:+ [translate_table: standard]